MSTFTIHTDTTVGTVHLIVRDPERLTRFYTESIGLQAANGRDGEVSLSADGHTPLLALHPHAGAGRPPARSTGLYHTAIRVPSRAELARLLWHLAETETRLQGASDHLVSEALYLTDPEGNGLEFYHDRPREDWPRAGDSIRLDTLPLNLEDLLADAGANPHPWTGLHAETVVGHVHLRVSDLAAAEAFYHGVLGFDVIARLPGQAGFVSAGGYHHHVGYNVWAGVGVPPPPSGSTGLDHFTIVLPDDAALKAVVDRVRAAGHAVAENDAGYLMRDPSSNGLLLMCG